MLHESLNLCVHVHTSLCISELPVRGMLISDDLIATLQKETIKERKMVIIQAFYTIV